MMGGTPAGRRSRFAAPARMAVLALAGMLGLGLGGCAVVTVTSAAASVVGAGVAVGSTAVSAVGSAGRGAYNLVHSDPAPAH